MRLCSEVWARFFKWKALKTREKDALAQQLGLQLQQQREDAQQFQQQIRALKE